MKNKNKKLIAVLSACCMATAVAAFATGCGKDKKKENNDQTYAIYQLYVAKAEDAGENALSYDDWLAAIKGEKGATGATGKSAYEIAVDNGFEGTEEEWLASLKGDPGKPAHEHTYDEDVEPVTLLAPTLNSMGLGYKTCESCDHIETVLVGITEIKEGEPITVSNNGEAILLQIPSVSKEGKLELEVVDADGGKVSASYTAYCILDGIPAQWPTNGTYYEGDNCVVSITYNPTYDKERTLTITAVILDGTEEYEHKVSVKSSDGTTGGVTAVQAYKGSELIAEAPVENGIATLTMPAGTYDLKVVGLQEGYKAVDAVTDGKRGGDYTVQLVKSYEYTVTVKNGEQLLDGATVNVTKANHIEDGKGYYDANSTVVATGTTVNGVVTLEVEETQFANHDKDMVNYEYVKEYGFYYQVSFTYDGLALDEKPCDAVDLSTSELAVNLAVVEKPMAAWDISGTVKLTAAQPEFAGKVTLTAATAGTYTLTFAHSMFTYMPPNMTVTTGDGQSKSIVKEGTAYVATLDLVEGDNLISVKSVSGNLMNGMTIKFEKIGGGSSEGGEEGTDPVIPTGTALALGDNNVSADGYYTFTATLAGTYEFSDAKEVATFYTTEEAYEADAAGTEYLWDSYYSDGNYSVELKAGESVTVYAHFMDATTLVIMDVAGSAGGETTPTTPTGTALALGDNNVSADGYYTFTATLAGTYEFSDAKEVATFYTTEEAYEADAAGTEYLWDSYYSDGNYSVSLMSGESVTVYIHFMDATNLVVTQITK